MRKLSLRALGVKKAIGVTVIGLQRRELKVSVKEKCPNKHVTKEYGRVQIDLLTFLT
jgi:hypothetical protein